MPRPRVTRVIVVGGGPAGSVATRLLASWGVDVVLLARGAGGERALAESIPPSGMKLLDQAGVRRAVDAEGFVRATGNTVRWGSAGAQERVEIFAAGTYGYQVDRARFDAVLLREAQGAGATVRTGATAVRLERAGAETTVTFEDATGTHTVRAEWVLDCTGRSGILAKQGWRLPTPGARTIALAGVWERRGPWPLPDPTHTVVESYDDGWGWSVPVTLSRRFVTLMLDPAVTPLGGGGREQLATSYHAQLARTRTLRALTDGAQPLFAPFARDASPYHASRYAERGSVLVGDAGSFVDPLSSFGIKKALTSAWLAAVVVRSCLEDAGITDAALALFDARERAMYDGLSRAATEQARVAASADASRFWLARATGGSAAEAADGGDTGAPDEEPDVASLRTDGDIREALTRLRDRETLRLQAAPGARREYRATVWNNRVVMREHLVVPAYPRGIRYVRNVDLVMLAELAPRHDQVPDLFEAYNRRASPCALPDFLGALALLVGKDALRLA